MKSAVLHAIGDIRIRETPDLTPGFDEVLIKVMACGVCGTDVHIFEGDKGAADNPLPIVLGHEFSGVVEMAGKNVRGFAPGDAVSVDPNVMCGKCRYCASGLGAFCENMTGIGTTVNGGFAQYCVAPRQVVYKLAPGVPFEVGAMAEPLSCCLHGVDLCELKPGSCVVIIGGGLIGLLHLQLARLSGAARVAVLEPASAKRETAKKLGADFCLDPIGKDAKRELADNGFDRVDAVIECVGKPETITQSIEIAGKHSVVMMYGLTKPDEVITVRPFEIFRKEITLKASFINPYTFGRAIELINAGRIDAASAIAEIAPLERLSAILSDGAMRARGKFIIDPFM